MRSVQTILLLYTSWCSAQSPDSLKVAATPTTEFLPILSYDTDVGVGYGVKLFALNHLGLRESFDLVLFNSSKGERWYRVVVSLPDFEQRQRSVYPLAVDVTIDYDKWIKNSFFGIGNGSSLSDREYYTKEPLELSIAASRGFAETFVAQLGVRYKMINHFNFSEDSRLREISPSKVTYTSVFMSLRYDTRNSVVNPSDGLVLQGESEFASRFTLDHIAFSRFGGSIQLYSPIMQTTVLAVCLRVQGIAGTDLPVQVLLPVGGSNTLRGFPQDRFLDKTAAVGNIELRFPIYWRFRGVVGVDAGKVWNRVSEFDFSRWAVNGVAGLRFHMDTFIVRLDVGVGKETTGFFLNFGQVF